jgi:LacI family transcriptional regulator
MKNNRVTIIDVAKLAGVSWKTVSRVVNRESNVSDAVRTRVQAAIDQLGYTPHLAARSLAGARAFTIGILFDNPSPHYTMKIQTGAYQACRAHGYHLLIENLVSSRADVAEQMNSILRNSRVDGFILTPPLTDCAAVLETLEARNIPYVRIAPASFPGRSKALSINDAEAAAEIARHFWQQGHRRFGLVIGPAEHGAAGTRRAGFLAALAELGHDQPVLESYGGFQFEVGIAAGRELLSQAAPPTAIFALNDDSAAGVIAAAAQLNFAVPQDVAVAGFDDSWIAQSVWPYLTTVHQPITEMACAAAEMLIARNGTAEGETHIEFAYRLVLRDSSAGTTLAP